jgi:hypothetical protein
MKILGASSLSSVLKRVLDIFWVFSLIAASILIVACAVRIAAPDRGIFPITLTAVLAEPVGVPLIKSPPDAVIEVMLAAVAFRTPSRSLVLANGLYLLLTIALVNGVVFHLRQVLASLTAGETFTRANARRLRFIAFLALGNVFVGKAWDVWSQLYLKATVQFATGRTIWPLPLPGLRDFFFALVLFVIAEAARVGAVLEEERALTV